MSKPNSLRHNIDCLIEGQLNVLNVVVSTPEARGGAIRAGLQFGNHLADYVEVDNLKMAGEHDETLIEELALDRDLSTTPSRTLFRNIAGSVIDAKVNFENTIIWTELSTPKPLKEYDIVHVHNAVPLWGLLSVTLRCRMVGVPYVMTTHGISKLPNLPDDADLSAVQSLIFNQFYLKPYLNTLKNAAHLFALSEGDRRRLAEYVPQQSVSVVPNGVSINQTGKRTQEVVAKELQLDQSQPLLLFVGKIMESKGVHDLLEAYERIDIDCKLLIVGPSKDKGLVDRMNEFPGSDIKYLGYTEREQLDALFQVVDLFVFPTRADVFPLVTLEAMAAGTPIVTTNVGGLPEQITNQTGILVEPENPEAIANAVERLLQDEDQRRTASEAALERVKAKFSWETVVRKTATTYLDILNQQNSECSQ